MAVISDILVGKTLPTGSIDGLILRSCDRVYDDARTVNHEAPRPCSPQANRKILASEAHKI